MLKQLVEFDHQVSLQLYTGMQGIPRSLLHYFCLTGEGYFWLAITPLLAVWCRARGYAWQESLWSNLWLANIIDIIFIAISKYVFRRARPLYEGTNKTASFLGPDLHSFPSGHTSRVWSIVGVLIVLDAPARIRVPATVWAVCTSVARVLLGRHYIGDVLGGVALGLFNVFVFTKLGPARSFKQLDPFASDTVWPRVF
ncbi:putative lipid phosphate phosphatase beta [Diplonema papillatum]|nr:putative lipid phosphate phosphatase beta [Diplonema papillatum]